MTSSNKIPNVKKRKEINKKEWFENKQYNTKTNKRISKSNSPQRKMTVNEELYIILWELEAEEIIYQYHIKHDPHLKVNQTLKEIKKSAYDWNNIEKDIRNFYFKCLTCEISTSKPKKNYVVKHIESDYPRENTKLIQCIWLIISSNDTNI